MSIRKVLKMGDPRLLQTAREVEDIGSDALRELITDMLDTMHAEDGAGLAAPQIGVDARVVVFEVAGNPRYPEAETVPRTVLINPSITVLDDSQTFGWEGCLSVPGMRGVVPRYSKIRYTGVTENGEPVDRIADGFHARVVQHECDHLDGILYPRRMDDLSQFGFIDALVSAGVLPPTADE